MFKAERYRVLSYVPTTCAYYNLFSFNRVKIFRKTRNESIMPFWSLIKKSYETHSSEPRLFSTQKNEILFTKLN